MKLHTVNELGFLEIQRVLREKTFYCSDLDSLQPWADELQERADEGSTIGVELEPRYTKNKQVGFLELDAKHFDVREP